MRLCDMRASNIVNKTPAANYRPPIYKLARGR